jgi:hypothetical protein
VWGLAVLAGVAGIIVQVIGTVTVLVLVALWDRVSPGSFARLLARLKPTEMNAAASSRIPDSRFPTPDP